MASRDRMAEITEKRRGPKRSSRFEAESQRLERRTQMSRDPTRREHAELGEGISLEEAEQRLRKKHYFSR